jgi:3-hydroxy-9,10-secoandrosta-1,3,5(10)-triene-9,17-dione monooxygenase reductase component
MDSLDEARFRATLGHYLTGVTVVAAHTPDGPAGFTCQSFASLSLDPPLVVFAARTAGSSWPKVRDAGVVGISILASDHEDVARQFATSGGDKFAGVALTTGESGAPLLADALAWVEGTIVDVATHGDHDVVVVAVRAVGHRDGEPLAYFRGGFRTLD